MRMLTDLDWLGAAHVAQLDSEQGLRGALADVRGRAKQRFCETMEKAATKYLIKVGFKRAGSSTPLELVPYFEEAVDLEMLNRYRFEGGNGYLYNIQEVQAVDEQFDARFSVQPRGVGQVAAPTGWIDLSSAKFKKAMDAFAKDNDSTANKPKAGELLPYLLLEADQADRQRMLKANKSAPDVDGQLLPNR